MWSCFLAWSLLLAGGIPVLNAQSQDIQVGGSFILNSLSYMASLTKCYVLSPANETIELMPTDLSDDRFELQEPRMPFGCSVWVRNAKSSDTGLWTIHSETEDGTPYTSTSYVSVIGSGDTLANFEDENENITWLTDIDYFTSFGSNITVTLNKTERDEKCFLLSNQGKRIELSEDVSEVKYFASSKYVSCRVIIGPFDGTMIGTWTLCGQSMDGTEETVRCQRANITWHNNSPNSQPSSTYEPQLDYVVNYGMTLEPGVSGSGDVHSCHVITPAGEDIALTFDSTYPKLARLSGKSSRSSCRVAIGPIDGSMIGDWGLYAVFTSSFMGNSEIHQPLHFYLYDESNPEAQAYNVTTLAVRNNLVNLGNTETFQVSGSGQIDDCIITTPSGQKYDFESAVSIQGITVEKNNKATTCNLRIGPITEDLLGDWELSGKFSKKKRFTEIRQPFKIIKEDPANPIDDGVQRIIENLDEEMVDMNLGATHRFIIPKTGSRYITYESCHLVTPQGLQYKLMEGFRVSGVEIVEDKDVACGVQVTVVDDLNVGLWKLFSREIVSGSPTEKRFNFDIRLEVEVNSSAKEVTIAEGNNFHIRLEQATNLSKTCFLTRPNGNVVTEHEFNLDSEYCEFVVSNMKTSDSGTWTINYGNGIIYKANAEVKVVGRSEIEMATLTWNHDQSVNITIGPEDAVYCRLISPVDSVIFDDFGRCRLIITRVTFDHAGTWKMSVGLPGRILTEEMDFKVDVGHSAPKAKVSTEVMLHHSNMELKCSLPTEEEVLGCTFKDPSGQVLLASHGVGEDRYRFYSAAGGSAVESNANAHECKLSISNPVYLELGLWRCAIATASDTYYGFLAAKLQGPEYETDDVTEPTLASDGAVVAVSGDAVTMGCSIGAPIRYCYFRARNGTIYNVAPGSMGQVQYSGAGFDAGECAVQFSSLVPSDSGAWTCHVGLFDATEQSAQFEVYIEDMITVVQSMQGDTLVIDCTVFGYREIEYCIFVRIDGNGFTSDNVPPPYSSNNWLESGRCILQIPFPTILELHPWTVVAKVVGHDVVYSAVTEPTFLPSGNPDNPVARRSRFVVVTILLISIALSIILLGMFVGSEKYRCWSLSRVSIIRNSIRMTKTPLPPPYSAGETNTASTPA